MTIPVVTALSVEGTDRWLREKTILAGIDALIRLAGDDPHRQGLQETPQRFLRAWKEWTAGYHEDPNAYLKQFDLDQPYDAFVMVRNISFTSHCEHHLAPFSGQMTVGYLPSPGRIVGLSKIVRVVRAFSRRLQVQERLVHQIANCIDTNLKPLGVGVYAEAQHQCLCSRGVNEPSATMVTCALRGKLLKSTTVRSEFFSLHNGK